MNFSSKMQRALETVLKTKTVKELQRLREERISEALVQILLVKMIDDELNIKRGKGPKKGKKK